MDHMALSDFKRSYPAPATFRLLPHFLAVQLLISFSLPWSVQISSTFLGFLLHPLLPRCIRVDLDSHLTIKRFNWIRICSSGCSDNFCLFVSFYFSRRPFTRNRHFPSIPFNVQLTNMKKALPCRLMSIELGGCRGGIAEHQQSDDLIIDVMLQTLSFVCVRGLPAALAWFSGT